MLLDCNTLKLKELYCNLYKVKEEKKIKPKLGAVSILVLQLDVMFVRET